jgi:membrane protease subunit (stomatin/prohibitin family)
MVRLIDVVSRTNVETEELAYREPQRGGGDFRMGSQVFVGDSQAAVFVRGGKALDILGPGRHTLSTSNLPIISGLIGLATSGRTPFPADLYFMNLRTMPQVGWGTSSPIYIRTNTGLGVLLLRTHGVMEIAMSDPSLFYSKYAVNQAVVNLNDIKKRIQTTLLGEINDLLLESGAQDLMEANAILEEIEGGLMVKINDKFAEMGLRITAFESNPFEPVTKSIEEMRDIIPFEVWREAYELQKKYEIGEAAANNPGMGGGLASAGVGLGVGQQLGAAFGGGGNNAQVEAMQQQMQQQQMMMQQMMMQMMNSNNNNQQQQQAPPPQQPAQSAAPANPQTREEIQAMIDNLDMKLMNGEISEAIYNRLLTKWQDRLDELG